MSRDTYSVLKRFLQDKNQSIVMNVIQEHLYVDMYEGVPRNKAQVESTAGAMEGEANRQGISQVPLRCPRWLNEFIRNHL